MSSNAVFKALHEAYDVHSSDKLMDEEVLETVSKTFVLLQMNVNELMDELTRESHGSVSYFHFLTGLLMGYLKYKSADMTTYLVEDVLLPTCMDVEKTPLHDRFVQYFKHLLTHPTQFGTDWITLVCQHVSKALESGIDIPKAIFALTQLLLELEVADTTLETTAIELCSTKLPATIESRRRQCIFSHVFIPLLRMNRPLELLELAQPALAQTQIDLITNLFPKHLAFVFESSSSRDLFHQMIYKGLNDEDSAVRKQTIHLVKLCLVHQKIRDRSWADFVMAYEVLDVQKENHLIDQVWPSILQMLQETFLSDSNHTSASFWPLKPSFKCLRGLIRRQLQHENPTTRRRAILSVMETLNLVFQGTPIAPVEFNEQLGFVLNDVIKALNDASLYKNATYGIAETAQVFLRAFIVFRASMPEALPILELAEAIETEVFARGMSGQSPRAVETLMNVFADELTLELRTGSVLPVSCRITAPCVDRLRALIQGHVLATYPQYFRERVLNRILYLVSTFSIPTEIGLERIAALFQVIPLRILQESFDEIKKWLNITAETTGLDALPVQQMALLYLFIQNKSLWQTKLPPSQKLELIHAVASMEQLEWTEEERKQVFDLAYDYCIAYLDRNEKVVLLFMENTSNTLATGVSICARSNAQDPRMLTLINRLMKLVSQSVSSCEQVAVLEAIAVALVDGDLSNGDLSILQIIDQMMQVQFNRTTCCDDCVHSILSKPVLPTSALVRLFTDYKWAILSHCTSNQPYICAQNVHHYALEALETAGTRPELLISIIQTIHHTLPLMIHTSDDELIGWMQALWMAYCDSEKTEELTTELINCVFQPKVICRAAAPIKWMFEKIWTYAEPRRPTIIFLLVSRLCACWTCYPQTCIPFVGEMVDILIYREPVVDPLEAVTMLNSAENVSPKQKLARIIALSFLETLPIASSPELKCFVDKILISLMELNLQEEWNQQYMINSTIFGRKLRCWQALCVLSKYLNPSIFETIQKITWKMLEIPTCSPIRYHMEIFAMRLCLLCPNPILEQKMLKLLGNYRQSAQVTSSILMIAGYVVQHESLNHEPKLLQAILPWTNASHGHTRVIAQYIVHALLPKYLELMQRLSEADGMIIRTFLNFLQENKESARMIRRQHEQFEAINPSQMCSVDGLLSSTTISTDQNDLFPESIHDRIRETAKDFHKQILERQTTAQVLQQVQQTSELNVQRKITPWDTIELEMEEHAVSKRENMTGRIRQDVIMCASLVDKTPNLAGLARTCEIFNASKLIVPNLNVTKDKTFEQISVTANKWMPMEQVKEVELIQYLLGCKQDGYTIIGLEQTAQSECLSEYEFPDKIVLVLGKEKEGIPVEILQVIDQCIEIPQLGLIRSLNVHVSGAIMLWEYTQQRLLKQKKRN